jgi:hypothetical protein
MPEIVGRSCAICRERITKALDAEWCRSCGSPIHRECKRPATEGGCPECGADPVAAAAQRLRSENEAFARRLLLRRHHFRLGLFRALSGLGCLSAGVAAFALPYFASRRGHRVVWYGAIVFGSIQLLRGAINLLRAARRGTPPNLP